MKILSNILLVLISFSSVCYAQYNPYDAANPAAMPAMNADDEAWQEAKMEDTKAAYKKYQNLFPRGAHWEEAETRICQLADLKAFVAFKRNEEFKIIFEGNCGRQPEIIDRQNSGATLNWLSPDTLYVRLPYGQTTNLTFQVNSKRATLNLGSRAESMRGRFQVDNKRNSIFVDKWAGGIPPYHLSIYEGEILVREYTFREDKKIQFKPDSMGLKGGVYTFVLMDNRRIEHEKIEERFEIAGSNKKSSGHRRKGGFGFLRFFFSIPVIGGAAYVLYKILNRR